MLTKHPFSKYSLLISLMSLVLLAVAALHSQKSNHTQVDSLTHVSFSLGYATSINLRFT